MRHTFIQVQGGFLPPDGWHECTVAEQVELFLESMLAAALQHDRERKPMLWTVAAVGRPAGADHDRMYWFEIDELVDERIEESTIVAPTVRMILAELRATMYICIGRDVGPDDTPVIHGFSEVPTNPRRTSFVCVGSAPVVVKPVNGVTIYPDEPPLLPRPAVRPGAN